MGQDRGRMIMTLNRSGEWRRGLLSGLRAEGHEVVFSERTDSGGLLSGAVLVTGSIDSTEPGFAWGGIRIDADLPENSVLRVSCHASDSREITVDGEPADLDRFLRGSHGGVESALALLSPLFSPAFSGSRDGLAGVTGRWLWLRLELLVPQPERFRLRSIKLVLAREKLLDYLPEIYRDTPEGDDFLRRFLEVFDSTFFEMEDRIGRIPERLDWTVTQGPMLRTLAEWVCLGDAPELSDAALRERMSGLAEEYGAIGTRPGIERFVEKELGVKPTIVEWFDWERMYRESPDREQMEELFGTDPHRFFLLLPDGVFPGTQAAAAFQRKLRENVPAGAEAEIVLLRQGIVLGKHTYLGVNSLVGAWSPVRIDENVTLSYDTLIGGDPDE